MQAWLNLGEKLDSTQAENEPWSSFHLQPAKQAESDLQTAKARVAELEQWLNKDQRSMLVGENEWMGPGAHQATGTQ
jgi:hypothetical protein